MGALTNQIILSPVVLLKEEAAAAEENGRKLLNGTAFLNGNAAVSGWHRRESVPAVYALKHHHNLLADGDGSVLAEVVSIPGNLEASKWLRMIPGTCLNIGNSKRLSFFSWLNTNS